MLKNNPCFVSGLGILSISFRYSIRAYNTDHSKELADREWTYKYEEDKSA